MASICASLLLLNAYKLAPNKLSEIMITMGFSMVIVALIEHLRGNKMEPHQWLGALISILGISLVHLKK
ncbi:MAG: hypothetical protein HYX22_01960 [Candidatus Yanofskybacteria bacterium]|nr:hypothetical protein [Candidatus Yanofskybacteria bacterium]